MSDDEQCGTEIPDHGVAFTTVHHGDRNDTAESLPHVNVVREKLRKSASDPALPEQDRQAAREVLRLSYNER